MSKNREIDWKQHLQGLRGLRTPPRPERPALLVIDMQKYFCQPGASAYSPGFEGVIPNVQRLIDAFAVTSHPVFATRYHSSGDRDPVVRWWDATLPKGDRSFDLDPRLKLTESAEILDKDGYGTFSSTDIGRRLEDADCDSVVICGVMTDLCCETTAREAFQSGYDVYFAVDGTATSDDFLHLSALATLAHGFAYIVEVEDIVRMLAVHNG
jgi:nicotinamidase-related amidase